VSEEGSVTYHKIIELALNTINESGKKIKSFAKLSGESGTLPMKAGHETYLDKL
jgi:hypothetical protein